MLCQMQSWEPSQLALKTSQKWEFCETCFLRFAVSWRLGCLSNGRGSYSEASRKSVPGKYSLLLPAGSPCHGRNMRCGCSVQATWSQRVCSLAQLYFMDCSRQAPLSMGFSWQKYCSELPFPPPGDLPDPGIEPTHHH